MSSRWRYVLTLLVTNVFRSSQSFTYKNTHTPSQGDHSHVSLLCICFGFGDTKFECLGQMFSLDENREKIQTQMINGGGLSGSISPQPCGLTLLWEYNWVGRVRVSPSPPEVLEHSRGIRDWSAHLDHLLPRASQTLSCCKVQKAFSLSVWIRPRKMFGGCIGSGLEEPPWGINTSEARAPQFMEKLQTLRVVTAWLCTVDNNKQDGEPDGEYLRRADNFPLSGNLNLQFRVKHHQEPSHPHCMH